MGSNSRYDMSRRLQVMKEDAQAAAPQPSAPQPSAVSLTPAELDLRRDPPRKPKEPIVVDVWLRVDGRPLQVPAECVEFTHRAVLVKWAPSQRTFEQVWVWASAVTRR